MGIAALVRLVHHAASEMTEKIWSAALDVLLSTSQSTRPSIAELVTPPERLRNQTPSESQDSS